MNQPQKVQLGIKADPAWNGALKNESFVPVFFHTFYSIFSLIYIPTTVFPSSSPPSAWFLREDMWNRMVKLSPS